MEVWEKREIPWEFNNNKKFIDSNIIFFKKFPRNPRNPRENSRVSLVL
jgi:hypothetical protein